MPDFLAASRYSASKSPESAFWAPRRSENRARKNLPASPRLLRCLRCPGLLPYCCGPTVSTGPSPETAAVTDAKSDARPPILAAGDPIPWPRALTWAMYDFANTIYSAVVVSFAITLHVKEYTGVEKYTFIVMAASLLVSGAVIPFAGELADRTGRAKRYLLVITLVCCASCALISAAVWAWLILLLFFVNLRYVRRRRGLNQPKRNLRPRS